MAECCEFNPHGCWARSLNSQLGVKIWFCLLLKVKWKWRSNRYHTNNTKSNSNSTYWSNDSRFQPYFNGSVLTCGLCSNTDTIHINSDGKNLHAGSLSKHANLQKERQKTWSFHHAVALHYGTMVQWSLVPWHDAQVFYDATWCSRNEMQAFSILPLAQMGCLTEQMAMLGAVVNLDMLHTHTDT